jgi:magnesium chelatase family protein
VLFLDELPEFHGHVTEVLRQPLEDRSVTITRASGTATFPAAFTLVAARNPCPCGYWGDPVRACTCAPAAVARYGRRISGPLLDRIDMHVHVPRVDYRKLVDDRPAEASSVVRTRVLAARQAQLARLGASNGAFAVTRFRGNFTRHVPRCNGDLGADEVRRFCRPTPEGTDFLREVMRQHGLSARAYHRTLKLALTIADLEGSDTIDLRHVSEAVQYRAQDVG